MKRTLFFCMLALLAGIYAAYFIPARIPVVLLAFSALVLLGLACFTRLSPGYGFMLVFFLAGAAYLSAVDRVEQRSLYPYVNEYVTVTANAVNDPKISETTGSATMLAEVTQVSFLGEEQAVSDTVYFTFLPGQPLPAFGERFRVICLLSLPEPAENSDDFDMELYLKSKKVFFIAEAEPDTLEKTGDFPLSFTDRLYQVNRRCGEAISRIYPQEAAAVLRAMALGDKRVMSDALEESLRVSGLSHVTSVSGMHVTVLLTALYFLLATLKQNQYRYFLPLGAVVLLFMLFTGATPSVMRASVMSVLSLLAFLCYRRADSLTSLGAAAGVIVALNPFAAFDGGFILSFGATLGILVFSMPMRACLLRLLRPERLPEPLGSVLQSVVTLFCLTTGAQLFILPVISHLFGGLSLWGFVTNLLAAPLLTVLLAGGLLMSFLGLLHPLAGLPVAWFVYPFVKIFLLIVKGFGSLTTGVVSVSAFSLSGCYLYALLMAALVYLMRQRYRLMLVPALSLPILIVYALMLHAGSGAAGDDSERMARLISERAAVQTINKGGTGYDEN